MGISFNNSDIINIEDTETGLKMLDKLSRIKDGRRAQPLDALDNISYSHRYLYDDYNLQIGDTYFMIPPEFIMVNSESTSQSIVTLRQENTQKMKAGHHKRTILIDLVFNGMEQLNGYPVDGPEGTYYVDGLRQLLAQFKCTPFLPISNELINGMYGVFTVALQSITMSTMQGFPDVMTAQITLQEVNMFPYIEMPDVCFKYMIDWDLFRFYYQRFLTEKHEYKKLQSLPVNKEYNRFKLSILDESVFNSEKATRSNMLDIICDTEVVTDSDSNYITWVDSKEDDIYITSFQCGYSNILTNIQLSDMSSPTIQFLGGMDTIYNITFETTDYNVVQAIEQCQITNDLLTRNNTKLHSVGFVRLESELVEFTGSLFVLIDSVVTNTVPGFPGLYNVQINCVSYDIAQSEREELHGFKPFECDKDDCIENDFEPDHVHDDQAIEQSMAGLEIKVKQDNYAEWKIRTTMEVYPDLHLPTYKEVNDFIDKCKSFRRKHDLSKLPYSEYPTNPTGMLHGQNPDNSIFADLNPFDMFDQSGGVIYTKDMHMTKGEYNIFVDPDFYVFYPNSYESFKDEVTDDNGNFYGYSPYKRSSKTTTKGNSKAPDYKGGTTSNTSLVEQFISVARSFIGHTYVWGAEGEQSDAIGKCFDCSGLVTYCLKEIGVMPVSQGRFTVRTMPGNDLFDTIPWDQMQRGDILCNDKLSHVVIYEGDNRIVHAANSSPYPKGGVKDGDLYFHSGTCLRPKAFTTQAAATTNTDDSSTTTNANGFYATDEFVEMVKKWEGFLGKATSMDGGIDIGYGFHNTYWNGTEYVKITYGMTMTEAEATKYLKLEMDMLIPKTIAKLEENGWSASEFNNNQILALTSYFYNRGYYNKKADALLDKKNSPTVADIGNNLPKYWGSASYAKEGLINRRNYEKNLFFQTDESGISPYTITQDELESICRIVMAETKGENQAAEKAVAQVIYDRLTVEDGRFGGLSNILQNRDQFPEPYKGILNLTVKKNVEAVFCNNEKIWPNCQVLYFLTSDDNTASFKDRNVNYDKIGEAGCHTFWGVEGKGSEIKYVVTNNSGTGKASSNIFEWLADIFHDAKTINDIKKFAEPVLVRTDSVIYDDSWGFWKNADNKDNAKNNLNDGENIFNTSFCDEYQYSCRGRLVRAFPAYLFCVLDDNAQWYDGKKLWSNYYIHRSTIDIAVHATNDMPTETATIVVSNTYHNLDRTQGGLGHYKIANDEGYSDFQRWFYKHTGLLLGLGPKLTEKLIQLHQVIYDHTKLREGARVHLRMGYGSDPLSLAPVMNGHVSDVTLGDQIQIVVTSDGHELIQHITSSSESKKEDTNDGFLGLFGLFEDQESSNIIANILCERQSWFTYLANQTFEGSKYGIEHYGLFFNTQAMMAIVIAALGGVVGGATIGMTWGGSIGAAVGSVVPVIGTAIGTGIGILGGALLGAGVGALAGIVFDSDVSVADLWNGYQEQYDICKNIYKADYSREHYIYTDALGADGEQNMVFNKYNMTPWDVFQICTQQVPEYIVKSTYHQFDSRLYFGLPFWMEKYRYDYLGGEWKNTDSGILGLLAGRGVIAEECKASSQVHILDFMNIIDNQVRVTSRYTSTNIKAIYVRGEDAVTTDVIHSDDTIDFAYQKTTILDTPITQDALGPDAVYEFLGYNVGEEAARRVAISNLLYGWQQQYQGQIIVMGNPGIKPNDYVLLNDSFAKLYGIAVVREVVHSFSINTGFTTSITLGLIGFSTDETSGMIETCQNLLSVLACFASYIETRRDMRNNYEQTLNIFSNMEILRDKFVTAVNRSTAIKVADGIVNFGTTPVYVNAAYKSVKALRNAGNFKNVVDTTIKGYKLVATAAKSKSIMKTAKVATAVITKTLKFNPVTLIATIVIDALLSELFDWLSNRNVCVLLPLWWEDYPFVCNTKDGEKILLMQVNSFASEQYAGDKDIKEATEIDD